MVLTLDFVMLSATLLTTVIGMLGPNLATFQLLLALKLGVMETTCVAECTGTVRSTAPLGRIDTVAAVAPSRRCSSL